MHHRGKINGKFWPLSEMAMTNIFLKNKEIKKEHGGTIEIYKEIPQSQPRRNDINRNQVRKIMHHRESTHPKGISCCFFFKN